MLTLTVRQGGKFSQNVEPSAISNALKLANTIVWLDIKDPGEADTRLLRDEFGFHPLAIEDAIRAHERPKVDAYEHALLVHPEGPEEEEAPPPENGAPGRQAYYFIVFYEARLHRSTGRIEVEAINLFVGRNYLVTVHQGDIQHVQDTLTRWQLPDSPLGNTVGALVHAFLDAIVDDYFPLMDDLAERAEDPGLRRLAWERATSPDGSRP